MSTQGDAKLAAANLAGLEEKFERLQGRIKSLKQQIKDFDVGIFSADERSQRTTEQSWRDSPVSKGQARHGMERSLSLAEAEIMPTVVALLTARMAAWKDPRYAKYYPIDVIEAVENYVRR